QLNPLPDKDLVDLCPPIEPYQVTKSHFMISPQIIELEQKLALPGLVGKMYSKIHYS
ncbi:unnamed protein product, partial [Microcystis aeruginosa NIES-298]